MLAVLSGLLRPTHGRVWLRGEDVTDASPQARARGGLARTFQQPELFLGLTVPRAPRAGRQGALRTAAALARHDRSALPPAGLERRERAGGRPARVLNLTRVAKAPVAALPLGVCRLVEVGRALAGQPHVILLDEPLSGLDMKSSESLLSVFQRVVSESDRDVSLLMVEHDVAAVLALSNWIFVLDFGERIAADCPDVIRRDPAVRSAYLGDEESVEGEPDAPSGGEGGVVEP